MHLIHGFFVSNRNKVGCVCICERYNRLHFGQIVRVTHSKIRQMWFDDRFDNCLRNQIVFTFEFRLYHSKPCDNQIALFKTRVNRGQYLYSY